MTVLDPLLRMVAVISKGRYLPNRLTLHVLLKFAPCKSQLRRSQSHLTIAAHVSRRPHLGL